MCECVNGRGLGSEWASRVEFIPGIVVFFFFLLFFFFLFHAVADPKHKIIIGDMRDGHTRQVSGGRKILRL